MANSYNVQALPDYVEQHKSELIGKSVLGTKASEYFTLMTGVKGATALNLMDTEVEFGDGSVCGWNEAGQATLSQRVLEPAAIKVNMAICDKTLLNKYANYLVRVEATKTDADLPFEKELVDQVTDRIVEKLNAMVWTGTKGTGSFDGIVTLAKAAGVTVNSGTSTDVLVSTVLDLASQKPEILTKGDFKIFAGYDAYMAFAGQLINKNLYHYDPKQAVTDLKVVIPGTNIEVIAVSGLEGKAVGARTSNLVYGTNLQDGEEIFDIWYSKDNREFRLAVEFTAGVQIAYPDEVFIADSAEE